MTLRFILLLAMSGCLEAPQETGIPNEDVVGWISPQLHETLVAGESVDGLVVLDTRVVEEEIAADPILSKLPSDHSTLTHYRARRYGELKEELLQSVSGHIVELTEYSHLPILHLSFGDVASFDNLVADPLVLSVIANEARHHYALDAQSPALINATTAQANGDRGAGVAVAVIDTGLNYSHADFGACSTPGGNCIVAAVLDTATSDNQKDAHGHGTNVAAIVRSVVPDSKLIGIDAFAGDYAWDSDVIEGINWAIANRSTYNIRAINMSLGGGKYSGTCDGPLASYKAAIDNAKTAGIVTIIAAGNEGWNNAVAGPGCVSTAVTVGAAYDAPIAGTISWGNCSDNSPGAKRVTCFSNSRQGVVDIVAPGALIDGGGYKMGGTSQASPHVAGAIASVASSFDANSTPDEWIRAITTTHHMVNDPKNNVLYPFLNMTLALDNTTANAVAPTGTLVLAGNAAAIKTNSTSYAITASDDIGIAKYCFMGTGTTCTWAIWTGSASGTVALSGTGTKTVSAKVRDGAGNVLDLTDTIVIDKMDPSVSAFTASATAAVETTLSWTATDNTALTSSIRIATGTTAPSNCNQGTLLYSGSDQTYIHTASSPVPAVDGTTYAYRLCVTDAAGNVNNTKTTVFKARSDFTAPSGTLILAGGASGTSVNNVSYTLAGTDNTSVYQYCMMGVGTTCTWVAWPGSVSATVNLGSGTGAKTVKARLRDAAGNVVEVSDAITIDKTLPTDGTLSASPSGLNVILTWSGFADAGGSQLAKYRITGPVSSANDVPAKCASGADQSVETGSSYSATTSGAGTWFFRVCAVDGAGNVSNGKVASATTTSSM